VAICSHVIVTSVDHRLAIAFDVEHAGAKHVPRVVGRDLDVSNLEGLVQLDRLNLVNAILDHLRTKAVYFALLGD